MLSPGFVCAQCITKLQGPALILKKCAGQIENVMKNLQTIGSKMLDSKAALFIDLLHTIKVYLISKHKESLNQIFCKINR